MKINQNGTNAKTVSILVIINGQYWDLKDTVLFPLPGLVTPHLQLACEVQWCNPFPPT